MSTSHSSVTQAAPSMNPQLQIIQGEGTGQLYQVRMNTRIGRETDNDVVLSDTKASRHHAEISLERGQWVIRDLGSYNQTLVNGVAITQPTALVDNTNITIGEITFLFTLPQSQTVTPPLATPQRSNTMFPLIVGAFLVLLIAAIAVVFYATFNRSTKPATEPTPVAEQPIITETASNEANNTPLPLFEPPNLALAYKDDFSDSKSGWDDAYDKYTRKEYGNNRYQVEVSTPNLVAWGLANRDVSDFNVEVEARLEDGGKDNSYGLLFRFLDKENFYRFDTSNDGYFLLTKFVKGKWVTLIDWTASKHIKPNESNLLKVSAFGNNIAVWANNELLASITDDSISHGNFGFFAGTFGDPYLWVSFDNLELHVPSGQEQDIAIIPTATKVFAPLASAPTLTPLPPTMTPMASELTSTPLTEIAAVPVETTTITATLELTNSKVASLTVTPELTATAATTATTGLTTTEIASSVPLTATTAVTTAALPEYASRDQPLPRGQKAASGQFVFPLYDPAKGMYDIYMADAETGENLVLLQANASQPAVSQDRKDFAYRSWQGDRRGLFARPLEGGEAWHFATFFEDSRPTISPKSKTLMYYSNVGGGDAAIYWITNGVAEVLRRDGNPVQGEGVKWINEKEFVYKSCVGGTCGIMLGDTVGGGGKLLTDNVSDRNPEVSPDGSTIVFMSQRNGNWDIYRMDMAGQNITALTKDAANEGLPTWSADGQYIAFVANNDGEWSIWEMDPNGQNKRRLFALPKSIDGVIQLDPNNSRGWTDENIVWLDEVK